MFRADKTAGGKIRAEVRPHLQSQDSAYLVIQSPDIGLAGLQTLEIRVRKKIGIIGIALARVKSVGPGAVFHIQTVRDGLSCIVRTSPVAYDHAVEAPLPFQYVIEEILIVAAVLIPVKVV